MVRTTNLARSAVSCILPPDHLEATQIDRLMHEQPAATVETLEKATSQVSRRIFRENCSELQVAAESIMRGEVDILFSGALVDVLQSSSSLVMATQRRSVINHSMHASKSSNDS